LRRSRLSITAFPQPEVVRCATPQRRNCRDPDCFLDAHARCATCTGNCAFLSAFRRTIRIRARWPGKVRRKLPVNSEGTKTRRSRLAGAASITETALRRSRFSIEEEFQNALPRHGRRRFYRLEHGGRTRAARPQRGCARRPFLWQRG